MKPQYLFYCIGIAVTLPLSFCGSHAADNQPGQGTESGFAIVELFTSEGCSSCPPADEAMIKLAQEFTRHVYFLGYHVDYWDYIGWKDAFASADYTKRQNEYAAHFHLNSIYTPQVIINGEKELVGSRESQLRTTIQDKLKGPASSGIELHAKKINEQNITVTYKVAGGAAGLFNIALVQRQATTHVERGENKDHQLNHINVVRQFTTVAIDKNGTGSVDFKVPGAIAVKDLKVISFLQNKSDLKVTAANDTDIE